MHLLKGISSILFILCNCILVWIPLSFWIIQSTWTKGEKLSRLRTRMDKIVWWWTANNKRMLRWFGIIEPEVVWYDLERMSTENWYLVICNHQTWTDIVLLQSFLYGHIPPLKFFTKEQLIWVPFVGLAMKVLGFPYVKRVTKEQIKANPELRYADRDNTLAACDGFKNHPTTILNFVEGTRKTADKHARQSNDFRHLLRPKVGGLGYVIDGMDDYLSCLLDVTIIYPSGVPTFWEFLQGKCGSAYMEVRPHEIPAELQADVAALSDGQTVSDTDRRASLAQWVKDIWIAKDQRISQYLEAH